MVDIVLAKSVGQLLTPPLSLRTKEPGLPRSPSSPASKTLLEQSTSSTGLAAKWTWCPCSHVRPLPQYSPPSHRSSPLRSVSLQSKRFAIELIVPTLSTEYEGYRGAAMLILVRPVTSYPWRVAICNQPIHGTLHVVRILVNADLKERLGLRGFRNYG